MSGNEIEELRRTLIDEAWAMVVTGTPTLILDISEIENADDDELLEIARRFGIEL